MPTVLVVDDSAVDRRLAEGILETTPDLNVELAADGAEALEKMAQAPADLVVTDLIMPEINGLELVAELKNQYPVVPVILMTSRGNEEIAATALRQGASSYVPKRRLARDLAETVVGLLAAAGQQLSHKRLISSMTRSECTFDLATDRDLIAPLVGYLSESAVCVKFCDDAEGMRIGVALEEALVNAYYHGNLEVTSQFREEDEQAYQALVEQRLRQPPYQDRRIHVESKLTPEKVVFLVRDEGPGFDPSILPDPTDPANLERSYGRGVMLMRTFMDDVVFNSVGNEVVMIKYRRQEEENGGGDG